MPGMTRLAGFSTPILSARFIQNFLRRPAAPVLQTPLNCADTYSTDPGSPLSPTLDWSDYVALDTSTQQAFQLQIDDDPLFASTLVDETVASTASSYSIGLGQLTYNLTMYWRVRVQSSNGDWSEWGTTGTLGTESNCFRTPLHPAPVCNFTSNPATPALANPTHHRYHHNLRRAGISQWSWNFVMETRWWIRPIEATRTELYRNITITLGVLTAMVCSKNVTQCSHLCLPDVLSSYHRIYTKGRHGASSGIVFEG